MTMTPIRAAGILNGTAEWKDPREYLEAALDVSIRPTLYEGLISMASYKTACHLADYAVDHGEEAAIKLLLEVDRNLGTNNEAACSPDPAANDDSGLL